MFDPSIRFEEADETFVAVEWQDTWSPMPWDHREFIHPDGRRSRIAVDLAGQPILDNDGFALMTGPGFEFGVVRATLRDDPRTPCDIADYSSALQTLLGDMTQYAREWGHVWTGTEHLLLTVGLQHRSLLERFGAALTLDRMEQAAAKFYEGPYWRLRLERLNGRRDGSIPRLPDDPRAPTGSLIQSLNHAKGIAARSGIEATVDHLVVAELTSERSLVLTLLREDGVDTKAIADQARTVREWLPLIEAIEQSEADPNPEAD